MKCIRCTTNNLLRERVSNAGRCKTCGHSFVLGARAKPSPRQLTDLFFQRTLAHLSGEGTLNFTRKQLFYGLNRRLQRRAFTGLTYTRRPLTPQALARNLILSLSMALGGVLIFSASTVAPAAVVGMGMTIIGVIWFGSTIFGAVDDMRRRSLPPPPPGPPISPVAFNQSRLDVLINQWESINGRISGLLREPPRQSTAPAPAPEVTAYSFDRVMVCDTDAVAQFLINNNFHAARNCAVLSISGYPQGIYRTVLAMLRRNPDLQVYALHNATPQGVRLAHELQTSPDWFANSTARIYDLGLSPRQVLTNSSMFVKQSSLPSAERLQQFEDVQERLTADELRWLRAGRYVELESFSPRKLLQIATRGLAAGRQTLADEDQTAGDGDGGFSLDNDRRDDTPVLIDLDADGDGFG